MEKSEVSCEHCHEKQKAENIKPKIIQIVAALIIFLVARIFASQLNNWLVIALYSLAYLIAGLEIVIKAFKNIAHGKIFDENLLMVIATIGAIIIGEMAEAVAVMLFYQIGEFFQDLAVERSTDSIAKLMDLRSDSVCLLKNGTSEIKEPNLAKIGDIMLIKPGEKIPLDGEVVAGNSSLNIASLTGESLPRSVKVGDSILSGSINIDGILQIKITKIYSESTASKIYEFVAKASQQKAPKEKFITKFAKYYTPSVVGLAFLIAFFPLLFGGTLNEWGYRALIFLVISCPCALVISIPLSFFAGIGAASRSQILIKGSNHIEMASKVDTIIIDKTGTITQGDFEVSELHALEVKEEELAFWAANGEAFSNHPIAQSITRKYQSLINKDLVSDYRDLPGKGVTFTINGQTALVGNYHLLQEQGLTFAEVVTTKTIVYVAVDKKYIGYLLIEDKIKDSSRQAIAKLQKRGLNIVMLTGDNEGIASRVAKEVNINDFHANLLPQDKVTILQKYQKDGHKVIYIGDGINDAPVLITADLGISMGGVGQDAAIEASDVVIMNDDLNKILTLLDISHQNLAIVKQNIVGALLIKVVMMLLGALGITNMWLAVFADVGVAFLAILNAIRLLIYKRK